VKCYGGKDGGIDLSPSGGKVTYSYMWDNGTTTEDRVNLFPGTYIVTVTDAAGCVISETITIGEPDTSMYVQSAIIDNPCFGDQLGQINLLVQGGTPILPDSTYQYAWNHGQMNDSIIDLGAGSYTVTITDYNLCTRIDTFIVNEPDQIVLSMTNVGAACGLSNGSATVSPTGGTTPYSYNWSNAGTDQTVIDLTGNLYYSVTVTDANACSQNAVTYVEDEGNPTVFIQSIVNVNCNGGNNGEAIAFSAGGTPPYSFSWSSGDSGASISGLEAGDYVVSVSDANGCENTFDFTVNEPDSLYALLNVVGAGCYGDSSGTASLYITNEGAGVPYTYEWSTGETTAQIGNLPAGSYAATITDAHGCVFETYTTVVPQPDAPLSISYVSTDLTCNSSQDGEIDLTVNGGTPFVNSSYNYYWSYGAFTEDIDSLIAGKYYVTVADSVGCSVRDSIVITEPDPIDIQFLTTASNCGFEDGVATLQNITGGTSPYNWDWSNSQSNDTVANALGTGIHYITVTDIQGCFAEFEIYIGTQGTNYVNIVPSPILCNGEFGGATANMPDGIEPFTYEWTDSTGAVIQTSASGTIDSLFSGEYSVFVIDSIGCTGENSFILGDEPPLLRVNITPSNVSCNNDTDGKIRIVGMGGTPFYDISVIDINNVVLYSSYDVTSDTVTDLAPGTYDVVVIDANGCRRTTNASIGEPMSIVPYYNVTDVLCYDGNDGIIQAEPEGGNGGWSYNWSDGQQNQAAINLSAGSYSVTITDIKGCDTTITVNITQPDLIAITDSVGKTSCRDQVDGWILANATGGVGGYTFNWSDGQNANLAENLSIGEYYLTVTDANMCPMYDTVEVDYMPGSCLDIPNAFTPNGDLENDTWNIKGIDLYEQIDMVIFNRWGDKVYEFSGSGYEYMSDPWDGKCTVGCNGTELPMGPFMFILDLNNDIEPRSGTLTIIR